MKRDKNTNDTVRIFRGTDSALCERELHPIRNYKDTVFRMIFKEKEQLLEVYNAINGTDYTNVDELEVTTIENAVYMSMKNDVSCMLDMRLQIYEQQSTVNPNMPLRDLIYVAVQYEKLLIHKDLYSKKKIALPTPKFFVFYNGTDKQPERKELRLSDLFYTKEEVLSLELIVTQLNINQGYNKDLMKRCPTLWQYMIYVNRVREYSKDFPLEQAVELAIDECIKENVLKEFLLKNKAGVIQMSIFEYDEELHRKTLYEEGREEMLISKICIKLSKGKTPEIIADELEESIDFIETICDIAARFQPNYDTNVIYQEFIDKME